MSLPGLTQLGLIGATCALLGTAAGVWVADNDETAMQAATRAEVTSARHGAAPRKMEAFDRAVAGELANLHHRLARLENRVGKLSASRRRAPGTRDNAGQRFGGGKHDPTVQRRATDVRRRNGQRHREPVRTRSEAAIVKERASGRQSVPTPRPPRARNREPVAARQDLHRRARERAGVRPFLRRPAVPP